MGRPKGGKNKEWSKEEKLYYVNLILSGEKQHIKFNVKME